MLEGVVVHNLQSKSVLLEHPSTFSLLGVLMIKAVLVDLPNHQPCQLPVIAVNESNVTIPARSALLNRDMQLIPLFMFQGKAGSVQDGASGGSGDTRG